jgi:hypothetical protein
VSQAQHALRDVLHTPLNLAVVGCVDIGRDRQGARAYGVTTPIEVAGVEGDLTSPIRQDHVEIVANYEDARTNDANREMTGAAPWRAKTIMVTPSGEIRQ